MSPKLGFWASTFTHNVFIRISQHLSHSNKGLWFKLNKYFNNMKDNNIIFPILDKVNN